MTPCDGFRLEGKVAVGVPAGISEPEAAAGMARSAVGRLRVTDE